MFYLALIIPCYNEESRIKSTFNAYFSYFQESSYFKNKKIAIALVNDGSQDKTKEIITNLENHSKDNITVKAISYEKNQGKGAAIKQGCRSVESQFYGFVDADLSFSPELTESALSKLQKPDAALIIGQRNNDTNAELPKLRSFFSVLLRRVVNFFLSIPNIDTQCGFKFFNKNIAQKILPKVKQLRFSFDIELITLSLKEKYQVKTLPLKFTHRNKSTITWRDGARYILDIISISDRLKILGFKKLLFRLVLFSAAISFSIYGWVIFKGYLFSDDFTWLWHGQKIGNSLINMLTFRMSTFYSPIMNAFYSLMYSVFNYSPQPFFLIGILVHILVSILSGILAWQLSKSKLISITVSCSVAFAGIAYEPLVWIGANMHSFVTLFVLLSIILFYQHLITKKFFYLILSFVSFILALGTKESAIVTPLLLLSTLIYYKNERKDRLPKSHLIFWGSTVLLSCIYLYQQYLWQKNSIWIQSNVWNVDLISFFRIPLILLDNFFPILFLKTALSPWSAVLMWLLAVGLFTFIIYYFKKLKLMWYGLFWLLVSISPFIFFKTEFWWEPLASRYNYLPRIGAIIIIASILHYLIIQNKSRHIISSLISIVIISISAQLYFMGKAITTEYNYVYNTGRTLTQAMQKIEKIKPNKILIRWDYPFTSNNAHLIGAASIITGIEEKDIIFLNKNEEEIINEREILLYWDAHKRKYEIKQNY